jgi:hypothetical protein
MRRASLLFAFLCGSLLAACGKDITKDVEGLADKACACTDKDCASKVLDELVSLAENNKNARGDQDKTNAAAQKLGECVVKAGVPASELIDKMKKLSNM